MGEVGLSVKLLDYTKDAEKIVADAARVCYASDERVKGLFGEETSKEEDARLIKMLAKMGHFSPFEHAKWTFFIEGVSRALTHQLVRHRVASYSQRSQRYVSFEKDEFDYVVPDSIKEAGMSERYHEMMNIVAEFYRELSSGLEEKLGLGGEDLFQDARYILPNACETKIVVTMNARELIQVFFKERLCNRAQWEIRNLAKKMLELCYPTAPNIFSFAGPECYVNGRCAQGKKSCGKMKEMQEYFRSFGETFKFS